MRRPRWIAMLVPCGAAECRARAMVRRSYRSGRRDAGHDRRSAAETEPAVATIATPRQPSVRAASAWTVRRGVSRRMPKSGAALRADAATAPARRSRASEDASRAAGTSTRNTATATTIAPAARATRERALEEQQTRKPIATVSPEKTTARPAVATLRARAILARPPARAPPGSAPPGTASSRSTCGPTSVTMFRA